MRLVPFSVGLLAAVVGFVVSRPYVVLYVSSWRLGYRAWFLLKDRLDLPFFGSDIYSAEHYPSWLRKGDVVAATGSKAGTIWMRQILHLIRAGGDDEFEDQFDVIGGTDWITYPGQTTEERIAIQNKKRSAAPSFWKFWIYGTELFPAPGREALDPKRNPDVRYIALVRNGHEVCRSWSSFIPELTEEWKNMFGGYIKVPQNAEDVYNQILRKTPTYDGNFEGHLYFEHVRSWWQVRHEPNVLLLHYTDMRKDTSKQIRRVLSFLNVTLSQEELDVVIKKQGMEHMKVNEHKYLEGGFGYPGQPKFKISAMHINTGKSKPVRTVLTEELEALWKSTQDAYLADLPGASEWAFNGGLIA